MAKSEWESEGETDGSAVVGCCGASGEEWDSEYPVILDYYRAVLLCLSVAGGCGRGERRVGIEDAFVLRMS